MLGGHDYLSDFVAVSKSKILSAFINEETKQIDTKSLVKFAQTSKTNLITVSEVLSHFLLTSTASHPNPFLQARENISNFIKHPEYRKPEWLLSDRIGKNYVYDEVIAGRFNDPVSKILLGEVTPEQQTILNRIAEILANPASVFTPLQREVLESRYIQAYIASGLLTLKQVCSMSWNAKQALGNIHFRAYIVSRQLNIEQILNIDHNPKWLFSNQICKNYVFDEVLAERFSDPVSKILRGEITARQQTILNEITELARSIFVGPEKDVIDSPYIQAYIASGQLTLAEAFRIDYDVLKAFETGYIRAYIASNQLTIERVLSIRRSAIVAFDAGFIRSYIASGKITIEQVLGLNFDALNKLKYVHARGYITSGIVNVEQVLGVGIDALDNLKSVYVRDYLARGQLTVDQALSLDTNAYWAFENEHVRAYIASRLLTIEQVLNITFVAACAFRYEYVRSYLASGQLTIKQVLGISTDALCAFENEHIRDRITRGELTPMQVLNGETVPSHRVRGAAPAEVLSNGGSGAASYHSLSTPLLAATSSERVRLDVARDLQESKCCESSCSIQ